MIDLNRSIKNDVVKKMQEIASTDSIVKTWKGTTYGTIQDITNPKKGEFGEVLLANWFELFGYPATNLGRVKKRGGGNVDLSVRHNNRNLFVEVKLATLDSGGAYQFGWIPTDYNYHIMFFLGISPELIDALILTSEDLANYVKNPTPGKTLTPVPSKTNMTHRKWTIRPKTANMISIETYGDLKKLIDDGIKRALKVNVASKASNISDL